MLLTHMHSSQRLQQGKDQKEAKLKEDKTGKLSLIPGLGRSPGEGNGSPLQYPCLENPMDRGAWQAAVHGVARSRTRLSDFTFTFHFHTLEKEMAAHSNVLAWEILWTKELDGLTVHGVAKSWTQLSIHTHACTHTSTYHGVLLYISKISIS